MGVAYMSNERYAVQFQHRLNKLLNIDPEKTPLLSMLKKEAAEDDTVRWQTTTFAAASSTNEAVQGSNLTYAAGDYIQPTSVFNYTQLSRKPFSSAFSLDSTKKPGAGSGKLSGFNNEKAKKSIELKRDMESSLTSSNDRVQPLTETSQAGRLRGAERWITTNAIDASVRPYNGFLNQGMVHDLARRCVQSGGAPDVILANALQRVRLNELTARPVTRDIDSLGKKLMDVIDTIVTIAGDQNIILDLFMSESTVLMLEMQYWEHRTLLAPESYIAGLLGSRTEGWVEVEHTLVSWAEKASGKITNLSTNPAA